MFIDEGLDSIDDVNISTFRNMLHEYTKQNVVFLITHSDRFKSLSTKHLMVIHNKELDYSYVE